MVRITANVTGGAAYPQLDVRLDGPLAAAALRAIDAVTRGGGPPAEQGGRTTVTKSRQIVGLPYW